LDADSAAVPQVWFLFVLVTFSFSYWMSSLSTHDSQLQFKCASCIEKLDAAYCKLLDFKIPNNFD